jgi:hypothetical protein
MSSCNYECDMSHSKHNIFYIVTDEPQGKNHILCITQRTSISCPPTIHLSWYVSSCWSLVIVAGVWQKDPAKVQQHPSMTSLLFCTWDGLHGLHFHSASISQLFSISDLWVFFGASFSSTLTSVLPSHLVTLLT